MDRPRTGRRRVRSGAVRATEIIDRAARRFPRPPQLPRVVAKPDDTDSAATAQLPAVGKSPITRTTGAGATGTGTAGIRSAGIGSAGIGSAGIGSAGIGSAGIGSAGAESAIAESAIAESAFDGAPASRGRRAAKLTGLALAALTLCATVATAAVVSREHRADALPTGQSSPITGQRALLPDDLTAAVSAAPTATRRLPAPSTAAQAASTAIVGQTTGTPGEDGTRPAAEEQEPPPSTVGMTDDELVAEYYRLVRSNPGNAFALLSGAEFGADLGHFVNAWSGVTDVRVGDITATADGVVADVRLLLATGQTLWVRQLFHVTESTPRRIANVTLLSAQVG